jgi:iron complex outermembrane receptor protein
MRIATLGVVTWLSCVAAATTAAQPIFAESAVDTVRVQRDRLPADALLAPIAITEVRASDLVTERQIGLDEALDAVPGVVAQSRSGAQDVRITIRGFGARGAGDRSNAGTTRGIRIQLDGFPLTEPDGRTSLDLADLGAIERIRVVRSNASALFGSASGGLIDLSTHSRVGPRAYALRSSFGSFGLRRQHAMGVLPFASSSIRLSISDTRFDGWRRHSRSETTTLQASVFSDLSPRTNLGVFLAGTRNRNRQPGALTRAELETDPRQADPAYVAIDARRDNVIGRVGVRFQHSPRPDDLLSIGAFVEPKALHRAERNRFRDFTRYHTGGSVLYRWALPVAPRLKLRLSSGMDEAYQDGTVLFYDLTAAGDRGTTLESNTREAINSLGLYSQLELQPAPKLDLSAGARYDLVRFDFEDFQAPQLNAARTMNRLSPRLTASYRLRPSQSVFAAFSSGIEAPAFNEVDPPPEFEAIVGLNPILTPAHSFTLEIGTKGLQPLRDHGKSYLRYDAALYGLYVYNDIIPQDAGVFYTTAGKSRRAGIELGGELRLANGLYSRLAFGVSHNEYLEYRNDLGVFDGNESAGIPPVVFDTKVGWEAPSGVFFEAGVHALGRYFADDANSADVAPYGIADLTVGGRRALGGGVLEGFAGVENLFDERYVASVFINGIGGRFFEPGMERTFLFGLHFRGR